CPPLRFHCLCSRHNTASDSFVWRVPARRGSLVQRFDCRRTRWTHPGQREHLGLLLGCSPSWPSGIAMDLDPAGPLFVRARGKPERSAARNQASRVGGHRGGGCLLEPETRSRWRQNMQPQDEVGVTSKGKLWTGRAITVFTVAFLLFD